MSTLNKKSCHSGIWTTLSNVYKYYHTRYKTFTLNNFQLIIALYHKIQLCWNKSKIWYYIEHGDSNFQYNENVNQIYVEITIDQHKEFISFNNREHYLKNSSIHFIAQVTPLRVGSSFLFTNNWNLVISKLLVFSINLESNVNLTNFIVK